MTDLANSFTGFYPSALYVTGRVTFSAGTPSLASLSGNTLADQPQVSIADNGTGLVTITVQNFIGQASVCMGRGAGEVQDTVVATSLGSYSGNAASVPFNVATGGTLADTNFNFEIWAY